MSQVSGLCVCPQAGGVEGRAEPEFGAAPELYRSQSPLQLSGAGWRAASRAGAEPCFREALRSGAPAFVSRCLFAGARRADFGGNRAGRPRAQAEGNPSVELHRLRRFRPNGVAPSDESPARQAQNMVFDRAAVGSSPSRALDLGAVLPLCRSYRFSRE